MYVGTDRPALKYLNKYVKADIATEWHDIGVELLDVEDEAVLNVIKNNYPGDVNKCAAEMLQLWLARKADASWGQLLEALREPNIKLNALAVKIESMLSEGMCSYVKIQCIHICVYVYLTGFAKTDPNHKKLKSFSIKATFTILTHHASIWI